MIDRTSISRRRALAVSGVALTAGIAGCTGSSDDGGDDGDDDDNKWQQPLDPDNWESVDEIRLTGYTGGWEGVEPNLIEGIRNPTLLLFDGNEYELTWENGDGVNHNLAIRNENNRVVSGLRTSDVRTRGDTATLEFEANTNMHEYLCEPHPRRMLGYIHVEE
ncbi:cupredoxin domain-containing protein [Natronorubrum sp. DTA7]|uniref:cupredoxin domain-containing protein n=1 Tax=Natronorubrum sp. DTA7 TaxID=3447016 RepID=UPI003F861E1C